MIQETIYAHTTAGECHRITIAIAKPEPLGADWGILVSIKSSDGTLDFHNSLYQVTPLLCLPTALRLITTLLQAAKENQNWVLSYSPELNEGNIIEGSYPM